MGIRTPELRTDMDTAAFPKRLQRACLDLFLWVYHTRSAVMMQGPEGFYELFRKSPPFGHEKLPEMPEKGTDFRCHFSSGPL